MQPMLGFCVLIYPEKHQQDKKHLEILKGRIKVLATKTRHEGRMPKQRLVRTWDENGLRNYFSTHDVKAINRVFLPM